MRRYTYYLLGGCHRGFLQYDLDVWKFYSHCSNQERRPLTRLLSKDTINDTVDPVDSSIPRRLTSCRVQRSFVAAAGKL